jgi:hypothetical protein
VSFCLRAHQVNLPVLVHTGVVTSHQKAVWWSLPDYRQRPFTPPPSNVIPLPPDQWPKLMVNREAAEQAARTSPIREKQVPEATEEVAVIVPVALRDNALPFLDSLARSLSQEQRGRVTVYVMTDAEDYTTQEAWMKWNGIPYPVQQVDAHHYLRTVGSFAEKVNRGYEISDEEWLFVVGDDVKFHPGWLDQAMEVARKWPGRHVIGTNDLGNQMVMAGEHATHLFIRRSYVANTGASWDGPGIVCHEGYRHWFVDNEIVEAAKQVDAWAPCLLSHVEHMHPLWGKGQQDEVYQLGQGAEDTDRELWLRRYNYYRNPEIMYGADGAALRVYEHGK